MVHEDQELLFAGARLVDGGGGASAALILVHGRGASAESILPLGEALRLPSLALVAPQAAGSTWYPWSFLAPLEQNEPHLSSALRAVGRAVEAVEAAGIPRSRILLGGFSQGACLALEFAARHAGPWAGIVGLSGGLIGADETPRDYAGEFAQTPVFLGCSDRDPHIPARRVEESAEVFRRMGAEVTMRLYAGLGHEVNADELRFLRNLATAAVTATATEAG